jgi:hypothetical protein
MFLGNLSDMKFRKLIKGIKYREWCKVIKKIKVHNPTWSRIKENIVAVTTTPWRLEIISSSSLIFDWAAAEIEISMAYLN